MLPTCPVQHPLLENKALVLARTNFILQGGAPLLLRFPVTILPNGEMSEAPPWVHLIPGTYYLSSTNRQTAAESTM